MMRKKYVQTAGFMPQFLKVRSVFARDVGSFAALPGSLQGAELGPLTALKCSSTCVKVGFCLLRGD